MPNCLFENNLLILSETRKDYLLPKEIKANKLKIIVEVKIRSIKKKEQVLSLYVLDRLSIRTIIN